MEVKPELHTEEVPEFIDGTRKLTREKQGRIPVFLVPEQTIFIWISPASAPESP